MKLATSNGKPTSEFILEFENKKGTPYNSTEQEYLDIINVARGHLQYYESLATQPTIDDAIKVVEHISFKHCPHGEWDNLVTKEILLEVYTALRGLKGE